MIYLALACRWLLAGAFLLAGVAKLRHSAAVSVRIQRALRIDERPARLVARWLPPLELAMGTALAVGVAVPWTGLLAAAAMVLFGVFLLIGRARDPKFDCGCFGSDHGAVTWVSGLRNVALAAAGLVVFAVGNQPLSLDGARPATPVSGSDGLAIGVATAAVLVGILLIAEAVRAVRGRELLKDEAWAEAIG